MWLISEVPSKMRFCEADRPKTDLFRILATCSNLTSIIYRSVHWHASKSNKYQHETQLRIARKNQWLLINQTFYQESALYKSWGRISFLNPCAQIAQTPFHERDYWSPRCIGLLQLTILIQNRKIRIAHASEHFADLEQIDVRIDNPEIGGPLISSTIILFFS